MSATDCLQRCGIRHHELLIRHVRDELLAARRLAGAHNRDLASWCRQAPAILEIEERAVVRGPPVAPQIAQDREIVRGVLVALLVILVAAPQSHLLVFRLVPARDDIQAGSARR